MLSECPLVLLLVGDGHLDIDTGLDADARDALHGLLGGVQVDHTLEDLHLEGVPGVRTVTARGLTGGDLEGAGGQTDGSANLDLLLLGAAQELAADLLDRLAVATGQSDADLAGHGGGFTLAILLHEIHSLNGSLC